MSREFYCFHSFAILSFILLSVFVFVTNYFFLDKIPRQTFPNDFLLQIVFGHMVDGIHFFANSDIAIT